MSGTWGSRLRLSIFGESHGEAIGMVVDGLPPGMAVDTALIEEDMARRAPGQSWMSTPRREPDKVRIVSGVYNGRTTGTPICGVIENTNVRSSDYSRFADIARPGHADYTGFVRYKGYNDTRGGGHFSGRLTAPVVFAGALARMYLLDKGVTVGARIARLGGVDDVPVETIGKELLQKLRKSAFPTCDEARAEAMQERILMAQAEADSVGGFIECMATGLPPGWGDPFFDSLESRIAMLLFSVPAVKGVEFGAGFAIADMRGSEANDAFIVQDGDIVTRSNNNGGILGGISSGMPIVVRVAIKPTPSIGKKQKTVNMREKSETEIEIAGRHDPCILPRAVPVIEAAVLIALADAALESEG
ncbi:MAG: chorismate synthase [Bacillota bacterium]